VCLPDDPLVMLERQPTAELVQAGELHAYKHEGYWQPMDACQESQHLNRLWNENKAPWNLPARRPSMPR
jgi:glucose-1-phosphate cytidylyltransferase